MSNIVPAPLQSQICADAALYLAQQTPLGGSGDQAHCNHSRYLAGDRVLIAISFSRQQPGEGLSDADGTFFCDAKAALHFAGVCSSSPGVCMLHSKLQHELKQCLMCLA